MKKYFCLLLVLAMCLMACDGKKSKEQNEETAKSSEQKETSAEDSVEQQESFADDFSATLKKAKHDELAKCEVYFLKGDSTSLQKALNGDEVEALGFKYLADEYPRYQTGKLAALYAGACYYNLGQYAEAIEYLDKFEADDLHMQPGALLLKGDAYVCLKDYAKAIEAYAEVVETGNKMLAPKALMKTGIVHLELKDKAAAKTAFETIKKDFPASQDAQNIDKYISSVE
jgi:tetratricopeptide (TPR) repeat protein